MVIHVEAHRPERAISWREKKLIRGRRRRKSPRKGGRSIRVNARGSLQSWNDSPKNLEVGCGKKKKKAV